MQVGDRFGNHLALVYNRRFIKEPPKTTDELVELAMKNTVDENGDGRKDRYGLVWNFTEPFFAIPFLTGLWRLGVRGSPTTAGAVSAERTAGAGARYAGSGRGVASSCNRCASSTA